MRKNFGDCLPNRLSLIQKRKIKGHEASSAKGLYSYVKFKALYRQIETVTSSEA